MIGDVLTSTILFEALRSKYPNAQLDYLINSHTFAVVKHNPFIDNIVYFTPTVDNNKFLFLKFLKSIRHENYDVVIDVYSKSSSNLITLFSGAKMKISKHKWYTSHFYSDTIKENTTSETNAGLAIENRLALLKRLGIESKIIKPKIYLTNEEVESSKTFLVKRNIDFQKPLFMISVLGSSENKTYPLIYMSKIIDDIVNITNSQILFNYLPTQITDAKLVFNMCKPETQKHIYFDVFGKSLREFLSITKHCTALIGNEGGAINMAKALNIPTFTIFSPWILKEAWNMFENGKTHVSIHLKDVKPKLYEGKSIKDMKKAANRLYKIFDPSLILPSLKKYLSQF